MSTIKADAGPTCRRTACAVFCALTLGAAAWPAAAATQSYVELQAWVLANESRAVDIATRQLAAARQSGNKAAQLGALRKLHMAVGRVEHDDKRARELAEEGLRLALELQAVEATIYFKMARYDDLVNVGREGDAKPLLDEIDQAVTSERLREYQGQISLRKAFADLANGRDADALGWYSKAYDLCEAVNDRSCQLEALRGAAATHRNGEQPTPQELHQALSYLKKAAALMGDAVVSATGAEVLHDLGMTHRALREYPEARLHMERSLSLAEKVKSRLTQAIVRLRLGQIAVDEQRFQAALTNLDRAEPGLAQLGDPTFLGTLHLTRAEALAHLGRRDASLAELERALAQIEPFNRPRVHVLHHAKAAEIHALLGRFEQAYLEMGKLRDAERRGAEVRNARLTEQFKVRFDVQLKEAENAKLRAQQSESEAKRLALLLALALTVFGFVAVALFLRQRARTLGRANATLERLATIGREITASLNAPTVFASVSHHAGALLDAPFVAIWLVEPGEAALCLCHGAEDGRSLPALTVSADDPTSNVARCAREQREILVERAVGADNPGHIAGTRAMHTELFAPLMSGTDVQGVLSIQSARKHAYGERERQIFRTLCAYAAVALANTESARRLAQIQAELEHQKMQNMLVHAGKMVTIGRMAAGMVHEMAHPVGTMTLLSENAQDLLAQGRSAELAGVLHRVDREAGRLQGLIKRLRDFARPAPPRLVELDLRTALSDAKALFANRMQIDGIEYVEEVDSVRVRADPERLSLVIANVAFNAMDAMNQAARKVIAMRTAIAGGAAHLSLHDTGPGLAPEVMERLFEPFHTTKPEGQGLGLGLALSAEAMASMHGRISAANHPQGGAVFTVILPLSGPLL